MTNKDIVMAMVKKNNGYITTKEVKNAHLNTIILSRLVKENVLERVARGYYVLIECSIDDYYKYQLKSKNCIFSHTTALFFYDLSDRTPLFLELTVPYGYNGSLCNEKNVVLHYVKKEVLHLGVQEIVSPLGSKIKVYDIERTICDIVKNKNKMDAEVFSKALLNYVKLKNKNLLKLSKYAKELGVLEKVREYMEVLL